MLWVGPFPVRYKHHFGPKPWVPPCLACMPLYPFARLLHCVWLIHLYIWDQGRKSWGRWSPLGVSGIHWWVRTWLLRDGTHPILGGPLLVAPTVFHGRPSFFAMALVISKESARWLSRHGESLSSSDGCSQNFTHFSPPLLWWSDFDSSPWASWAPPWSGEWCHLLWEWYAWLSPLCLGLLGNLLHWGNWCPQLGLCSLPVLHPWLALHAAALSVFSMAIWLKTLPTCLQLLSFHCWLGQICTPRCMPSACPLSCPFDTTIYQVWASTAWSWDSPGRHPLPGPLWAGDCCLCQSAQMQWHNWWLELKGVNDLSSPGTYTGNSSLTPACLADMSISLQIHSMLVADSYQWSFSLRKRYALIIWSVSQTDLLVSLAWCLTADVRVQNLP